MPVTLATHAMGTRFELVLDGGDAHVLRVAGEAALEEVRECHRRFSLFEAGSWLNTINRRAAEGPVKLDGLTFELLATCRDVYEQSGGAFDVTVAPLMRAWGFHGEGKAAGREAIKSARAFVGMKYVELDAGARTVRFTRPGVTLDLGGVAKGFAIDLAVAALREQGVSCALLHGGTSTVAAVGAPPGEAGWRVRLATGDDDPPVVTLRDRSLSVSAPHGRVVERDGRALGHVLDARIGGPADCGAFAAALGASACLTDAWATALLVLGERPASMPEEIAALMPGDTIEDETDQPTADLLERVYA